MTAADQKRRQAAHFDCIPDPDFEINRPHGESRLYERLMHYKMAEMLLLLGEPVRGCTILSICCGSGMDAEFFAERGARVVATDISTGALERARERGRRYGATFELAVADAECLPFRTGAFDYCLVHDGLHHLPRPVIAIHEMTRVSRRGVMITEPADARLTAIAIGAGVLKPYEESGNFVVRFGARDLTAIVSPQGFDICRSRRYMLKYGHPPAGWWRWFDHPLLLAVAIGVFRIVGVSLLGRLGNKLAFVAVRSGTATRRASCGRR